MKRRDLEEDLLEEEVQKDGLKLDLRDIDFSDLNLFDNGVYAEDAGENVWEAFGFPPWMKIKEPV